MSDLTGLLRSVALLRAMGQRDKEAVKKLALEDSAPAFGTANVNAAMAGLRDDPPAALVRLHQFYTDPHLAHETLPLLILAQWAAYFGDPAFSLELLRASHKPPYGFGLLLSLWRPVERDVRRLPAFKNFVRELGLVDYWEATGNWGEFCRPVGQDDFTCT